MSEFLNVMELRGQLVDRNVSISIGQHVITPGKICGAARSAGARGTGSKAGRIDPQAGMGQFPQFFEALPPGMNVAPIVENERAARLIDMETAYAVVLVSQYVRIRQLAQVVRTLSHVDDMQKARNEPHQARHTSLQRYGVAQHHANSAQAVAVQKAGQHLEARIFFEAERDQIAIEDQDLPFRPGQNRIAGPPIIGFTGKQCVGGTHD